VLNFKNLIIILSGIIVVMLILFFTLIFTSKVNVNGTYYGKGHFGSITIVVKEDSDIRYSFNFTDDFMNKILKEKEYEIQFVANKEFNASASISTSSNLTKENNPLLHYGILRTRITKPFTQFNIKVKDLPKESISLKKIK
jgi:hypothetical protein